MNARTRIYLDAQFLAYAPFPLTIPAQAERNGQLKVKLHGSNGETNWLNVTPEQARAIERVLLPLDTK